jgi:hypothetical protein
MNVAKMFRFRQGETKIYSKFIERKCRTRRDQGNPLRRTWANATFGILKRSKDFAKSLVYTLWSIIFVYGS